MLKHLVNTSLLCSLLLGLLFRFQQCTWQCMVVFQESLFSTSNLIQLVMALNVLAARGIAPSVESFTPPISRQEFLVLPVLSQVSPLQMQAINHYSHTLITPASWQCVNYPCLLVAELHNAAIGEDCKYVKSSMFPWLKHIRDRCLAVVNTLSFNWQGRLHLHHLFYLPCPHLHLCVKMAHLPLHMKTIL